MMFTFLQCNSTHITVPFHDTVDLGIINNDLAITHFSFMSWAAFGLVAPFSLRL